MGEVNVTYSAKVSFEWIGHYWRAAQEMQDSVHTYPVALAVELVCVYNLSGAKPVTSSETEKSETHFV